MHAKPDLRVVLKMDDRWFGLGDHCRYAAKTYLEIVGTETEIESCLAYAVLRDPETWIGVRSTSYLQCFLMGAQSRASCVQPDFPIWQIFGVLEDPKFYKPLVAATGNPKLTIKWATALAMTHHSLSDGFEKLRDDAIAWHEENGIAEPLRAAAVSSPKRKSPTERADRFWVNFAKRPAMFMGGESGWVLYCYLRGMDRGGDWLGLPEMPRLREVVSSITNRSEQAYGSPFAAFRVYNSDGLIEWADL